MRCSYPDSKSTVSLLARVHFFRTLFLHFLIYLRHKIISSCYHSKWTSIMPNAFEFAWCADIISPLNFLRRSKSDLAVCEPIASFVVEFSCLEDMKSDIVSSNRDFALTHFATCASVVLTASMRTRSSVDNKRKRRYTTECMGVVWCCCYC